MTVSGVSGSASYQSAQTTAEKSSTLDYNSFLKLLVAEMSHQDPLNPTDSTQYISQFASFSSVEQAIQTNKKLDSLMTVSALTQANSLIGRTATSADGSVTGKVEAVRVVDGGVQAVLGGGKTLMLEAGTTVK
ncbi:MAG: flagellar hook assembly protein FlgD [Aurantimonas endophytica]|uniref:Basal-body rod modification protein FlgD n=1 Tax=Aurantimonas endophytica TaxID=1522175 RepID=A0A7W6HC33_9HYPH|nr:flagellar hook assembly protein FlgD [Aurantimonas endophytica]MBB4002485.1 flagellar basal-body rod modification protein FlgD [Aurantimonas endophytica]MCO6401894.1 flagellar hook assembly protein FlgD [Aurantimonas endophytica]